MKRSKKGSELMLETEIHTHKRIAYYDG